MNLLHFTSPATARATQRPNRFFVLLCAVLGLSAACDAAGETRCVAAVSPAANAHSLAIQSASFVGLGSGDSASGVAIAPDCSIILGVTLSNVTAFADTANISNPLAPANAGTSGSILQLSADGSQLLKRAKIGAATNDIAVNPTNGDIAIAADIGVIVLASDLATVRWTDLSQVAARVDIASDGVVVALRGGTQAQVVGDNGAAKTYTIYNATGSVRASSTLGGYTHVADIAIDATTQRIFVTGFAQRNGSSCSQLQVAWLIALDYDGVKQWGNYDYALGVADANNDCADTRGRRVAVGEDGKVYFAGTSAGGNAIFRWLPGQLGTTANNAQPGGDSHVNPFNTRSNHITYAARFEPASGALIRGFFLLTRLTNTNGNTIEPRAITGDAEGRFYVGGFAAFEIKNRSVVNFNGTTMAAYAGSDAWLLVTSPDLTQRETWVAFNNGGQGVVRGLVAKRGSAALAASINTGAMFTTSNALQSDAPSSTPTIQNAGYFAQWSAPSNAATVACNFDVDSTNGTRTTSDGVMLMRYLLNLRGVSLTAHAKQGNVADGAVEVRIQTQIAANHLDIDGNGVTEAATDGLLLLRSMLGFRDDALTANALGAPPPLGAWRNTGALIRAHLATNCGLSP
jgi:hypothetical protein